MPGRVFISCGQATQAEQKVANDVSEWLRSQGYDPYVAIETQSIQDVNSGIIGNLKSADYYIFIDFRREKICNFLRKEYRGSLFTNQELAIAYFLGFDRTLFIQQSNIRLEGIARYILGNAKRFDDLDDVLKIVKQELGQRNWSPNYSRHLVPNQVTILSNPLPYKDHTGPYNQYICHIEVENRRHDSGAFSTIARLDRIELPSRQIISPDSSYLKWAGQSGYERIIPAQRSAKFDAFAIENRLNYDIVYLHSSADIYPRQPILQSQLGQYILHYEVIAQNFPLLELSVLLNLTGNIATTTAVFI